MASYLLTKPTPLPQLWQHHSHLFCSCVACNQGSSFSHPPPPPRLKAGGRRMEDGESIQKCSPLSSQSQHDRYLLSQFPRGEQIPRRLEIFPLVRGFVTETQTDRQTEEEGKGQKRRDRNKEGGEGGMRPFPLDTAASRLNLCQEQQLVSQTWQIWETKSSPAPVFHRCDVVIEAE